jgi:DNA-binding NarL/FixJ family response regulator
MGTPGRVVCRAERAPIVLTIVSRPLVLTARQQAVVALLWRGRTCAEMAGDLAVRPATIKRWLTAIYVALGIPAGHPPHAKRALAACWLWRVCAAEARAQDAGEAGR